MNYTLYLSEDSSYVIIELTGNITRKTALEFVTSAYKMGREYGTDLFLVDATKASNNDSILHNYQFAYDDLKADKDIDKTARVAILVNQDDHSHDFVETVLINSGSRVKLFRDKEKAIDWILGLKK